MKSHTLFGTAASLALASMMLGCAGMKLERVPPGQSIRHHLEGPPQQATETLPPPAGVEMPTTVGDNPSMGTESTASPGQANPKFLGRSEIIGALPGTARAEALPPLPVSGLPERNDSIERAGEAYNRGNLLMKGGQNREAVAAFEEATQLDPAFSDAWTRLTMLYEKVGQPDKAREAFRRAKGLNSQPERLTTPVPLQPAGDTSLPQPKN